MSCKRAEAFLGERDVTVRETVDARKERYAGSDLKKLFGDANKVIAAKGKKVEVFDMKKDPPSAAVLQKATLGPSGNLRAPALKMGKTWLVGFGEDAWTEVFG